jgi:hypothetical protein
VLAADRSDGVRPCARKDPSVGRLDAFGEPCGFDEAQTLLAGAIVHQDNDKSEPLEAARPAYSGNFACLRLRLPPEWIDPALDVLMSDEGNCRNSQPVVDRAETTKQRASSLD